MPQQALAVPRAPLGRSHRGYGVCLPFVPLLAGAPEAKEWLANEVH